ncbi:hypothetical protein [Hymenobacter rubidus]|uniref:hypothetical protein n=1 Tax=Hymenobacter rubidus TaxID=1441626 RepID=UPI00191ED976|nr:hypothetical protein [Hymenobacter rubidus]
MSPELLKLLSTSLMYTMQASVLVPMIVVWRRQRHFPAAIKILSWYVYLSAFCSIMAKLCAIYLHNNLFVLIGFNTGKVLLFAAMYGLVMPTWKRTMWLTVAIGFMLTISTMPYNMIVAMDVARVVQCAVLAGLALLYMDYTLTHSGSEPGSQNPYWLLSVGQLVYSAGTVTGFSLDWLGQTSAVINHLEFLCVAGSGLAFNYFLTLAFLRANRTEPTETPAPPVAGEQVGLPPSLGNAKPVYGLEQ